MVQILSLYHLFMYIKYMILKVERSIKFRARVFLEERKDKKITLREA